MEAITLLTRAIEQSLQELFLRLVAGVRRDRTDEAAAVEAVANSDAPTVKPEHDRLEFTPLARGISRFLRNENTTPPLTLAVTGDWGSGKSSLMGLICTDLVRFGWRPVSFNAWHHQNEEQMLAALLTSIQETALPPLLTPEGASFRLRLLWQRARKHWRTASLLFVAAAFVVGFIVSGGGRFAGWDQLFTFLQDLTEDGKAASPANPFIFPAILAQMLVGIPIVIALVKALKAFGVDPAVLLSSTVANFKLKDASAQTSFRMRFARQFGEVTKALRHPMVIVIDDLDRCKPTVVQDMMEAVNFLTTSGRCHILFGMATRRVLAALALSFQDIAKELVEFDAPALAIGETNAVTYERERRQNYARDYLEKLINIEIAVPQRDDLSTSILLEPEGPNQAAISSWTAASFRTTARLFFIAVAAAILFSVGQQLAGPTTAAITAAQISKSPAHESAGLAKFQLPNSADAKADSPNAQPVSGSEAAIPLLLVLAAGGAGAYIFFTARPMMRRRRTVGDSRAFRDALTIWLPIATFAHKSPRSIKRFGNRIRYLAMLQQGARLDDRPDLSRTLEALEQRVGIENGRSGVSADVRALVLADHRVVALGALHAHLGEGWRDFVMNEAHERTDGFGLAYRHAVVKYIEATNTNWPPASEELDAFERSLKGIRLPGDPDEIGTVPREPIQLPPARGDREAQRAAAASPPIADAPPGSDDASTSGRTIDTGQSATAPSAANRSPSPAPMPSPGRRGASPQPPLSPAPGESTVAGRDSGNIQSKSVSPRPNRRTRK